MSYRPPLALHLRSSDRPQALQTHAGRLRVWTECGEFVDSTLVDNESASCPDCQRVDAARAEPRVCSWCGGAHPTDSPRHRPPAGSSPGVRWEASP